MKILLAVAVVIVILWCISTVNDFKRKEIRIEEGRSGIEVALTKRYNVLTKMLDTAKGYMTHENDLFTKVIKLRQGMSVNELNSAQVEIEDVSNRLIALSEDYPELKSSDVFVELQRAIRDAEEHLQAAYRLYNSSVRTYNTAIEIFQTELLAGQREPYEFFVAESHKREEVKMTF